MPIILRLRKRGRQAEIYKSKVSIAISIVLFSLMVNWNAYTFPFVIVLQNTLLH